MSQLGGTDQRLDQLEKAIAKLSEEAKLKESQGTGIVLIIFSNNMDRILAALNIAVGALSMGKEVSLFFTFWGGTLLKEKKPQKKQKLFVQKLFGWLLPKGPDKLALSQMNFGGMGGWMMRKLMKKFKNPFVGELMQIAKDAGAKIYVCSMTMELMGIKQEEIVPIPSLQLCGVAKFIEIMQKEKTCLFI